MTGLENIDCMVVDKLEAYMGAKQPPSSDVLATYEIEYSAKDSATKKRTIHIGNEPHLDFVLLCSCGAVD